MRSKYAFIGVVLLAVFNLSFKQQEDISNNYYKITEESTFDSLDYDITVISGNIISSLGVEPIGWLGFQKHDEAGKDYKTVNVNKDGTFIFRMPAQKGVLYAQTVLGNEIILPVREYKDKSWIKINFYSNDSLTELKPIDPNNIEVIQPQVSFKPVIYLYNQDKIDVSINLDYKGDLTFTYPEYKEGWKVTVDKKGIKSNDRSYPYLFWEGEMFGLKFNRDKMNQIPCRKVKKQDVVSVLRSELSGMGLNPTEMTDFITFWAPRMERYEEVAIQFLRNDDYSNKVAKLTVEPRPRTTNRIYLLYTPITQENENQFVEIRTNYEKFVRKGFTLIEWGGSEISYVKNIVAGEVRKKGRNEQVPGTIMNSTMELKPTKSK